MNIARHGLDFRGELRVMGGEESIADKFVSAQTCEDVVEALALVTALTIDPEASTGRPPAPKQSPASLPIGAIHPLVAPVPPLPALVGPSQPTTSWTGGLLGEARSAVAPGLMGGGGLFVDVAGTSPWAASARLSLSVAGTGERSLGPGAGQFRFYAALMEGCPTRVPLTQDLTLAPCAGWQIGVVQGEGTQVREPASAAGLWSSVQLNARLAWQLSRSFSFSFTGGGVVPVTSPTFIFDGPRTVAHQSSWIGGVIGVGLGYQLGGL